MIVGRDVRADLTHRRDRPRRRPRRRQPHLGPSAHTDSEWIGAVAAVVKNARLTTLLLPGIGTIENLERAHDQGITSVRVSTHATEDDMAAQHIAKARDLGMDVSGFLMMSRMAPADALAKQAKLMESYGAHCVYVTELPGQS